MLKFDLGGTVLNLEPEIVIAAGFTGRDQDAVAEHVAELETEGVPTPSQTPSFYDVAPEMAWQRTAINVTHADTSGEVEIAFLIKEKEIYVTLASDHTDRKVETLDIAVAKRVCPKLLATAAWRLEDVISRWDSLEIRSWIFEGDQRILYQFGKAEELLPPDILRARIPFNRIPDQYILLGGTVPAIGGIRGSSHFWNQLHDPTTGRKIELDYRIHTRQFLSVPS